MLLRTPHYYKDFKCIADKCIDNCCVGGWQIDIDEETVEYYKTVPGKLGEELKDNLEYTDEYCFKLKDGKCPFLDNNNLCRIYQELGEEHMGVVCTQFPRYSEYYGNFKETGIGLACEEAARIILTDSTQFSLITSEISEESLTDSELDNDLSDSLFVLRDKLIAMMDTNIHFSDKLNIILNISNKVQQYINLNDYEHIKQICNEFHADTSFVQALNTECNQSKYSFSSDCESTLNEAIERIWYAYLSLETLNEEWEELSSNAFNSLHPDDITKECSKKHNDYYTQLIKEFDTYMQPRINEYNKLMQYYLFRYFCKAAYDHDLYGKAQLIICNYLIIHDLGMYKYNSYKNFTFEDQMDIIHIFSRDIEYSTDNILSLYEEFLFDEIFNCDNLSAICTELL